MTDHVEVLREMRDSWAELDSKAYDKYVAACDAAIRALSLAGGDRVMVPRVPTDAMLRNAYYLPVPHAGAENWLREDALKIWNAMLAASPQQEPGANGTLVAGSRGKYLYLPGVSIKSAAPAADESGAFNALADDEAERKQYERDKLDPSNCLTTSTDHDPSGQTLAGAGGVDLDLGQFREAVNCWRAVITTAAVNLPFNLAAYRASCGVSVPDRLLALIDSQSATSAGTTGDGARWRRHDPEIEREAEVIYNAMPYDEKGQKPAWVPHGNSLKQDEARNAARRAREVGK